VHGGGEPISRSVPPTADDVSGVDPDQDQLLPPSLDEWLPAEHWGGSWPSWSMSHLDLSRIHASNIEAEGAPRYNPRLMVRLLVYGYAIGIRSSRKLEAACVDVVALRWLAVGQAPDYRSIARFRRRHLSALGTCSRSHCGCARPLGWSGLGRSRWTARNCVRTRRGARR
jgi:hypothetical protein